MNIKSPGKSFTMNVNPKLDAELDELRQKMGVTSRADVFRWSLALMKAAQDAKEKGFDLAAADKNGTVQWKIVLP